MPRGERRVFYVVLAVQPWDVVQVQPDRPVRIGTVTWDEEAFGMGFMAVFDTREAAEHAYPGVQVLQVEGVGVGQVEA